MEDFRLEQTGQEVQDILNGAAMQSDLTAEVERAQNAESTLQGNIDAEETRAKAAEKQNADDIDAIEEKIPSGASSSNKLTTEEEVNDKITTATATFKGTFNLIVDLHLEVTATHVQIADALLGVISSADNNDYCFVQIPTSNADPNEIARIERYKFNGEIWAFEYTLNNSGFTAAQWAAINSGITSNDKSKLDVLPNYIQLMTLFNGKQNVLTFDTVPTQNSTNPVTSGGIYDANEGLKTLINGKQNKLTFDNMPTEDSANPVTSGGVYAADALIQQAIQAILALIPSAATALNQLADKQFVNSSIETSTAVFRGTFNLVSDLSLNTDATHAQIATALLGAISNADNNDYAFVQVPTSASTPTEIRVTERYKFNGTIWQYEYDLNNSGFTAAQWEAINSGITTLLVTKLGALPTSDELVAALAGKQAVLTFDQSPTINSANPVTSNGIYQAILAVTNQIDGINAKIPAGASSSNKLVAEDRLASYVAAIIGALDATYNVTSTDGHVTVKVTQVDGAIANVDVLTNDIASSQALSTLDGRVTANETDIAGLHVQVDALTGQKYVTVTATAGTTSPTDVLPSSGQATDTIYRIGSWDGTQYDPNTYSEYAWTGTEYRFLDRKTVGIDEEPTAGSHNLVESGGVKEEIGTLSEEINTYLDLPIKHEIGSIHAQTGQNVDNSNRSRTSGYILINQGMEVKRTADFWTLVYMYDENKNYLGYREINSDLTYYTIIALQPTTKYIRLVDQGSTSFRYIIDTNGVPKQLREVGYGVFDISIYNAVGGVAVEYAGFAEAVTSGNVPEDFRKGGMTVRFIDSTINEYVQYRLMKKTWSTNISDWQGIDEKPVDDSRNLVESGGVKAYVDLLDEKVNTYLDLPIQHETGAINAQTGKNADNSNRSRTSGYVLINQGMFIRRTADFPALIYMYDSNKNYLGYSERYIDIPYSDIIALQPTTKYIRLVDQSSTSFRYIIDTNGVYNDIENQKENIEQINKEVFGTTELVSWDGEGRSINISNGEDGLLSNRNRTNYFEIDAIESIIFNESSPLYYVVFYNNSKTFISSIGWKSELNYNFSDKPEGAVFARIMIDTTTINTENVVINYNGLVHIAQQLVKNIKSILVVDANGNGDYTTIEGALANAGDSATNHVTILVKPGVYYPVPFTPNSTPYNDSNRNISIIGLDRDACILRGNVGYYDYTEGIDYALLRLNGNVLIKNLTLINTCENYEEVATEQGWDLSNPHAKAYCIHVDSGRSAGTIERIENCKMYNDHFACVGWGLRSNTSLIIKDCECISDVSSYTDVKSDFSHHGTLYGHLAAGETNAPNQRLEIIDCKIRNVHFDCGILQGDSSGASDYSNISASFLFIHNILRTTDQANAYLNQIPSQVYIIDDWSYGNNINSMNYQ